MAKTYDEYTTGWDANNAYRADTRAMNNAGGFSRTIAVFFAMVGLLLVSQMSMLVYMDGWANLRHPFIEQVIGAGVAMMVASVFLYRRHLRLYRVAKADFDAKWRSLPARPALACKSIDDPVTHDDLKLLTMAAIRLTPQHPDVADEVAKLKVRLQKLLTRKEAQ